VTVLQPIGTADRSLSSQIYEQLREAIIEGHLMPGVKLREQALADQFSVSRVPLREAIPQLEAEGFVHTLPRRGTIVTQLTMRDVHDLFDIRESLETLAARLAAARIARADPMLIAQVEDCLRRARLAVRDKSDRDIAATSAEFHALVVELSGNAMLRTMMRPISGRVRWLFRLTSSRDQRAACRAHEGLFNAIRQGDVERAGTMAHKHIASGRQPSVDILHGVIPE
jgi:DNA-binding GntR family transcriptional regulator